MRAIDFMSVFFLLGSAPYWQAGLDDFCSGLGSALLILLLISASAAARQDVIRKPL
jgi:hypothetical protein